MSATTITKLCAINIDHNLGVSAGELSACWVYLKDNAGKLIGLEGAAYIYTMEKKLMPMWQVIFYGGQTLERHKQLYEAQRPHLDSRTRRLIRQAIEVSLIKDKMLGTVPESRPASDDYSDATLYGMSITKMVVEDGGVRTSPVPVNGLQRK
ncbi:hypothetical protein UFOVP121_30 [uncultured Caudovirales phage]|uniref:Uncharacterized protein n=1 Tax=uncultured Caudovirales phage TaxID=2100421 RepID=A0A6J5L8E5_9CAUD|nr:hypothetical protein UFOVP121_30 [uncultured Caudovirales phage]CAB4134928.1 hypothetical protein UFOVP277_35 [uncultured Caudovirales phage]